MTEEQLQAIEKLLADATPGPWEAVLLNDMSDATYITGPSFASANDFELTDDYTVPPDIQRQIHNDATLIASAPTLLRALVAEVRRLNKMVSNLILAVDAWEDTYKALEQRCKSDK